MVRGNWDNTEVGLEVRRMVMLEGLGMRNNLWHEACMMGIVRNEERNEAIRVIHEHILTTGGTGVLIFVDYIEHGNLLSSLTGVPFVSSESENRTELFTRFKSGELRSLITSPILDEGVDVSRIHHIILSSGRKSEIKLLQRIGRGLRREEGKVLVNLYDFYDDEIPMLEKHTKKRLEIYKQEGFPVEFKQLKEFENSCKL
jgi:superfamily II DNA or RNA helicase